MFWYNSLDPSGYKKELYLCCFLVNHTDFMNMWFIFFPHLSSKDYGKKVLRFSSRKKKMWHEKITLQFLNGHITHSWNPVASIETPVCVNTEDTKIITFLKGIRLSLKLHICGKTNCPAFFLYYQKPWLSPWGPVSIDVTFFGLFLLFAFCFLFHGISWPVVSIPK